MRTRLQTWLRIGGRTTTLSLNGLSLKDRRKPRPRHRERLQAEGPIFQAGEIVRKSGIYEAIHEDAHRQSHEVVLIEDDLFPSCDTCSERVRFRLVRSAPYIFTDEDFER
jgi:hypothetical protein